MKKSISTFYSGLTSKLNRGSVQYYNNGGWVNKFEYKPTVTKKDKLSQYGTSYQQIWFSKTLDCFHGKKYINGAHI